MKKNLLIKSALLLTMAVMPLYLGAQNTETYPSYIDASGYAEREVAPDVFYLRVNIDESVSKGKLSLESQQKSMMTVLKNLGLNTEKQVTRLSLSSQYHNRKGNYAYASYQIKFNNSDQLSKAWQKLDEIGITDVYFTKAEYSDIEKLKEEVRQEAVKNAQEVAKSMAEAIGQSIGKCFYISSGYSGNTTLYAQPRTTKSVRLYDAAAIEEEEESIEFDNIKVTVNVSTKFILNIE